MVGIHCTKDLLKTLLAAMVFLIEMYVSCLGISLADRWNGHGSGENPLRDLLIPILDQPATHSFPSADLLVKVVTLLALLRIFLCGNLFATVLRRTLLVLGTLYLLRTPFLLLTLLPSPWKYCVSDPYHSIFLDALWIVLQRRIACGDVFWSGHSILLSTSMILWSFPSLTRPLVVEVESDGTPIYAIPLLPPPKSHFLRTFLPIFYRFIQCIVILLAILGYLSLLYDTLHYSIDVLVAIVFSFGLWSVYSLILRLPLFRKLYGWTIVFFFWERCDCTVNLPQ
jgi:hypothetical protein